MYAVPIGFPSIHKPQPRRPCVQHGLVDLLGFEFFRSEGRAERSHGLFWKSFIFRYSAHIAQRFHNHCVPILHRRIDLV